MSQVRILPGALAFAQVSDSYSASAYAASHFWSVLWSVTVWHRMTWHQTMSHRMTHIGWRWSPVCCRALDLATMPSLSMHTKHRVVRRRDDGVLDMMVPHLRGNGGD